MKKILPLIIVLAVSFSCEHYNPIKPGVATKGIVITDLQHDDLAKNLFQNIMPTISAGRVQAGVEDLDTLYKYFDLDKDIINYSLLLPQTSTAFFENLVVSKIGDNFYGFILRYTPDSTYTPGNGFSGLIQRYDLSGAQVGEYHLPLGKTDTTSETSGRSELMYMCVTGYEVSCHDEQTISTATGLPIPGELTTVCVNTVVYNVCDSGSGGSGGSSGVGTIVPTDGSTTTTKPIGSSGSSTTDPANYTSPVVVADDGVVVNSKTQFLLSRWEATKIDDTQLKPCMQSILTSLKNLTNGSVAQIIQKFSGSVPGYNWELKDGALPADENASTSTAFNTLTGTVTTTFDASKFTSSTDLSIARTILHESIHAYVIAATFNTLTDTAKRKQLLGPDWLTVVQNYGHDYITSNYLIPLANALQEYGNSVLGYGLPSQFYQDLAWGGLTNYQVPPRNETTLFQQMVPNTADRIRIRNIINIELTGKDYYGNTQTQKGRNAGC